MWWQCRSHPHFLKINPTPYAHINEEPYDDNYGYDECSGYGYDAVVEIESQEEYTPDLITIESDNMDISYN